MLEIVNNQVLKVEEKVTPNQTVTIRTHYELVNKTKLVYDSISSKVTASVYIFDIEAKKHVNNDTYNGEVIFKYEDQQISVNAINGIADIDFTAEVGTGEHIVKTANELWDNGEVIINV